MAYRIKRKENVSIGVRRIAAEEIEKTLAEIDDPELNRHDVVHRVRKRCKKLRGLLRLVRPQCEETFQFENACIRDAAATLSNIRDAESICECFDKLIDRYREQIEVSSYDGIARTLRERRRTIAREQIDLDVRLVTFRTTMQSVCERISSWPFEEKGFSAIGDGLKKTYSRARKGMANAGKDPTAARFHEWRKRVKYHGYHTRLLRNVWKPLQKAWQDELKHLSDNLGDMHDLEILRITLMKNPDRYGATENLQTLFGLIGSATAELAERSLHSGERLFCEKAKPFARRWKKYWKAWRNNSQSPVFHLPETIPVGV